MQYLLLGIPVFIVGVIAANYWGPDAFGWVFIGVIGAVAAAWALGLTWAVFHGWRKGYGDRPADTLKPHMFVVTAVVTAVSGPVSIFDPLSIVAQLLGGAMFVAALIIVGQLYIRRAYVWMVPVLLLATVVRPFSFLVMFYFDAPLLASLDGLLWIGLYRWYAKWAAEKSAGLDRSGMSKEIAK